MGKKIEGILMFPLPRLAGSGIFKPSPSLSLFEFLEPRNPALNTGTCLLLSKNKGLVVYTAIKTTQESGAINLRALNAIDK